MKNLTKSAANTYAILDSFADGSVDILDSIAPFFEPILTERRGQTYNPEVIADDIRKAYKWNFTSDIAEECITRLETRGWIQKDDPTSDYSPFTITIEEGTASEEESQVLSKFDDIAESFMEFSQNLSPITSINNPLGHFKEILIEWLLYVDAYSEENLNFTTGTYKDESGTLKTYSKFPNTTDLTDDEKYLCARFVENSLQSGNDVASTLCQIASIGLLTEVVQDFHRPTSAVEKTNLVVFLDAPIALELLGVSGKAAQENIEPIIGEIQRIGSSVRVFEQSLVEMSNSLTAVLNETNPTGPTAKAMMCGDVLPQYVKEVAADPGHFLNQLNVSVVKRNLEQYPNEHSSFTKENYDDLFASLSFQSNIVAREHDATVAALIMRQRKGRGSKDVFNSHFILLTRNGLFAQQARRRCIELEVLNSTHVPPVIHRRVLATAAWLRTGLGFDREQIPKRMLLASCERVLAIREGTVQRVKQFSNSLSPENAQQLDLLLSRDKSTRMLMDKTLGSSKVITEENLPELFNEMMKPYIEEIDKEKSVEIEEVKRKAREKVKSASKESNQYKEEKQVLEFALNQRKAEDISIIDNLCDELSKKIQFNVRLKKCAGLMIAAIITIPAFLYQSTFVTVVTFLTAVTLAYLSVIGSHLIKVGYTENEAINKFMEIAEQRALVSKIDQSNLRWTDNRFDYNWPADSISSSSNKLL